MLLSQVEGFLEVASHRNLSRAATALHVTQPALTARIQALEAELGTTLFLRGRHGMELTDAGRAFLPYAERAVGALDAGAGLLRELGRGGTGELVLGAAPAVSTYVLPALLVRYTERFPNVRLVVRTGHSSCATPTSSRDPCTTTSWCWSPAAATTSATGRRSASTSWRAPA
jgi:DNA-binding transcriptional LysR family regulator